MACVYVWYQGSVYGYYNILIISNIIPGIGAAVGESVGGVGDGVGDGVGVGVGDGVGDGVGEVVAAAEKMRVKQCEEHMGHPSGRSRLLNYPSICPSS